jgi:putative ABC transport system permease protein
MVGATLVSALGIVGASAYASIGSGVERTIDADYIVSTAVGQPFSAEVAEQVRGVEGVARVGVARLGSAMLDGRVTTFMAADEAAMTDAISLRMVDGSMTGLVVDTVTAQSRGWAVGDRVAAVGANGAELDLQVAGTYEENVAVGPMLVPLDVLDRLGGEPLDRWLFVDLAEGADAGAVRAAAEDVLAEYPVVSLKDRAEFTQEQQAQVGQILLVINAMLVLSVLVAVLGIVNTLALSVLERTREVGLLRAVGMQRRQLRRVVRWEAVLIALFGTTLGLVLGVVSGTALVQVLDGMGIDRLDVPAGRLAGLVATGAVVGVLAAVWPARRAARMPVLRAIAATA